MGMGVCFPALALKDILACQQRKTKMGDDAVIDAAFKTLLDKGVDAGGNLRGLWRVQKLEIVEVPKGQEGKFYEGDCYIHFDKNPVEEHVHFWIGNECSVGEQAVAAIKAVELDNLFGGLPVQHREGQGFESKRFKDQFPDGIMIKKGGMEGGLKKAETNAHEAKLFKISGGMRPVMQEVDMAWSSMNHGDVFVLDSGKKIFVWKGAGALGIWVWLGKSATKAERQGVMQMGAKFIKDNKLPPQTALTRTFQGMEPDEFKSLFMEGLADW